MKNFKLFLTLMMVAVLGCGEMWATNQVYTLVSDLSTLTSSDKVLIVSSNGSTAYYALKNEEKTTASNLASTGVTIESNSITADLESDYTWYFESAGSQTIENTTYAGFYVKSTKSTNQKSLYLQNTGATQSFVTSKNETDNNNNIWVVGYTATNTSTQKSATGLWNIGQSRMLAEYTSNNSHTFRCYAAANYGNIENRVVAVYKMAPACSNSVSLSPGTSTNALLSLGKTSIETCSANNADREVEITVTPSTCYTLPASTRLDFSGVSAIYVSGPNNNKFVYRFAQNAKGNSTVTVSLSTKTTYTVSYNKGTYGTGDNGSGTKTCGEELALPNSAMFTREGYTQKGWSTAPAGNTKTYNLGGNYTNNSATTLYPYWEANDCAITWVVNGDPWTGKGGSTTAKYDGKVANLPTAPTTEDGCGDKFMGWTKVNIEDAVLDKTDDAATITSLNCFTDVDGSPVIQGATTFYAVFATYVKK